MFRKLVGVFLFWGVVACSPESPAPLLSVRPGGAIDAALAEPPDAHHRAESLYGAAQGNVSTEDLSRTATETDGKSPEPGVSARTSSETRSSEATDTSPYGQPVSRSATESYHGGIGSGAWSAAGPYDGIGGSSGGAWGQWSTTTPFGGSYDSSGSYRDRPLGW